MKDLNKARVSQEKWVADAVADGWSLEPTCSEPVETAGKMHLGDWVALYISRPHDVHLNVWGPDGLDVVVPEVYKLDALRANLRKCGFCGAADVDVVRISFAGRTCRPCHKKNVARIEHEGWTR